METAGRIGLDLNSILDLDIRLFDAYVLGATKKRETEINDQLHIGQLVAGKTAQAVWGNRDYQKPLKEVKLVEDKDATKNELIRRKLAFYKRKGII